jgi:hypothetical protein
MDLIIRSSGLEYIGSITPGLDRWKNLEVASGYIRLNHNGMIYTQESAYTGPSFHVEKPFLHIDISGSRGLYRKEDHLYAIAGRGILIYVGKIDE